MNDEERPNAPGAWGGHMVDMYRQTISAVDRKGGEPVCFQACYAGSYLG